MYLWIAAARFAVEVGPQRGDLVHVRRASPRGRAPSGGTASGPGSASSGRASRASPCPAGGELVGARLEVPVPDRLVEDVAVADLLGERGDHGLPGRVVVPLRPARIDPVAVVRRRAAVAAAAAAVPHWLRSRTCAHTRRTRVRAGQNRRPPPRGTNRFIALLLETRRGVLPCPV